MKILRSLWIVPFIVLLGSCTSQYKLQNYLENIADSVQLDTFKFPEPLIQKNDILYIQVYSESLEPQKTDAPYNNPTLSGGTNVAASNPTLYGFLVDHNGDIEYPRIGKIHSEGLTKSELANVIKTRLSDVLTNPSVNIRFLAYKVTVLGEVTKQGPITISGERITIMEAIGEAGGITWNGRRDNIRVIRETNGKREMGLIDLTSKDVFKSPYYNLQQNDLVVVDLNKRGRISQNEQYTMQRVSFAVGIITTFALLINIFK